MKVLDAQFVRRDWRFLSPQSVKLMQESYATQICRAPQLALGLTHAQTLSLRVFSSLLKRKPVGP
jgi:hypothetical protein